MPYPVAAVRGKNFGSQVYSAKVLNIQAANLILYHPMNEPSGGTAIDASPEGNDGAYTGVTLGQTGIGDGETCPLFDGANDFNDIYSAGLNTDFDEDAGTIAIWAKVSGAGIWTDNAFHWMSQLRVNATNRIFVFKNDDAGNKAISFRYIAGGTNSAVNVVTTTTDWFHIAWTWDTVADEMKAYYNGSQTGSTQTGLGNWVGNLVDADTLIGANSETPDLIWDGCLVQKASCRPRCSSCQSHIR